MQEPDDERTQDERKAKKARMRAQLDSLHNEIELAEHATDKSGNMRRKLPRKVSLIRTKKRKELEKVDRRQHAISVVEEDGNQGKRLRGSKAAFEDNVIQGSLLFGGQVPDHRMPEDEDDEIEEDDEIDEDDIDGEELEEVDDEDDEDSGAEEVVFEDAVVPGVVVEEIEEILNGDDGEENDKLDKSPATAQHSEIVETEVSPREGRGRGGGAGPRKSSTTKKKTRIMHRLRDFKSYRMSQRHGDALGAHARGLPKVAIQKLKAVAGDAPAAPQVYSSLGMVYENMLHESQKSEEERLNGIDSTQDDGIESHTLLDPQKLAEEAKADSILKQIGLAKKAYGGYHVSALLCKKDFTLWLRAADTAMEIVDLYKQMIELSCLSHVEREESRAEKKKWLEEAKQDYTSADNLRPPGIDIPAKLAVSHIELGNLSEALTILTDLKNRGGNAAGVSTTYNELHRSFRIWLLYSDLMLRIGHECMQWNRGILTNENYMFRRWLRKYSQTFDWRERRLQSLCLALEAAAGSKSCSHLLEWTKKRASMYGGSGNTEGVTANDRWHVDSNKATPIDTAIEGKEAQTGVHGEEEPDPEEGEDNDSVPEDDDDDIVDEPWVSEAVSSLSTLTAVFEKRKKNLLDSNRSDLLAFDKETKQMEAEPSGTSMSERLAARVELVKSQKAAVVRLVGEFYQRREELGDSTPVQVADTNTFAPKDVVPLSASCSVVSKIACNLMKLCLELELYECGTLVGEAVSSYFKERAALSEHKLASQNAFDRKQKSTEESVLLSFEYYDEIAEDAEESDDDASQHAYLSDDEEIDENMELLESLKRGSLPPQIRVLYAISLIGQGGRNYVASKCIADIDALELENKPLGETHHEGSHDPEWDLFCLAKTSSLQKITAFSLVADVLDKTGRENEWSAHFNEFFKKQIDQMEEDGLMDKLARSETGQSTYGSLKQEETLKILVAATRMMCFTLDTKLDDMTHDIPPEKVKEAVSLSLAAISFVSKYNHWLWSVPNEGNIRSSNIEVLNVCSRAIQVMRKFENSMNNETEDDPLFAELSSNLKEILSFVCDVDIPELDSPSPDGSSSESWVEFPIPSSWQTPWQQAVSMRVHNLCVACNASLFSGWELDEFSTDWLRPRGGCNFFGVKIVRNQRVAGYVSEDIQTEISRQWEQIHNFLPWTSSMNVGEELSKVKETEWYTSAMNRLKTESRNETIFIYGEENALEVLLALSSGCLRSARTSEGDSKDSLLRTALSVLLPISQFCLDKKLWDSSIGTNAAGSRRKVKGVDWRKYSEKGPPSKPRQRSQAKSKDSAQSPLGFSKRDKPLFFDYIRIPTSYLNAEWCGTSTLASEQQHQHENVIKQSGKEAMQNVDKAMRHLRSCFTIGALQKASLQVALALLEMVAQDTCSNPFLCMQQAAIFASQGPKRGSSDDAFKHPLPTSMKECSPLEALVILCRADCFQALHFPNEGMFLCSEVVRVCGERRKDPGTWTTQWRIVGIVAYNVSVAIKKTMLSHMLKLNGRRIALDSLDADVEEELENCKIDGMVIQEMCQDILPETRGIIDAEENYPCDDNVVLEDDTSSYQKNKQEQKSDCPANNEHVLKTIEDWEAGKIEGATSALVENCNNHKMLIDNHDEYDINQDEDDEMMSMVAV